MHRKKGGNSKNVLPLNSIEIFFWKKNDEKSNFIKIERFWKRKTKYIVNVKKKTQSVGFNPPRGLRLSRGAWPRTVISISGARPLPPPSFQQQGRNQGRKERGRWGFGPTVCHGPIPLRGIGVGGQGCQKGGRIPVCHLELTPAFS